MTGATSLIGTAGGGGEIGDGTAEEPGESDALPFKLRTPWSTMGPRNLSVDEVGADFATGNSTACNSSCVTARHHIDGGMGAAPTSCVPWTLHI